MGRKSDTPLSIIATATSANHLNCEIAKHASPDRKKLSRSKRTFPDVQRIVSEKTAASRTTTRTDKQEIRCISISENRKSKHA